MKKTILSLSIFFLLAFFLSSCSKIVQGINNDPNNPTDADAILMLTDIQVGNIEIQEGELARQAGMYCGYFVGESQQYTNIYQYNYRPENANSVWDNTYSLVLKNARIMKQKAQSVNNMRLVGVAQVIEAHAMGTATDMWGDIPFKQACNPLYPSPNYDPQVQVYASIQSLLDSAIINLASSSFIDFSAQDIYYAGNMTNWTQAAYTLKARNYLHTRQYAQALASAQSGISAAANNMLAKHTTTAGTYNLYYQFFVPSRPGFMDANGSYLTKLLNASGALYRGNSKTIEKSRFNYYFSSATNPNYTTNGIFYMTASFPMISYAENLLILSEADTRVNGVANGLTRLNTFRSYMNGGGFIGASYLTAGNYMYSPYVIADFNSGGIENATPNVLAADRALLREIMEERFVTFYGQIEGFNDFRRTFKETDIRVPITLNFGTQYPQRILYPQTEVNQNLSIPNPIPNLFTPTPINQ